MDRTVKDLLAYARPRSASFQECRLAHVIERATALLVQEPAMRGVDLDVTDSSDLAPIEADEHQLEQLLLNLLLNAAHASSPGAVVHLHVSAEEQEITVSVRDEGVGMTAEVARRAFEPFYTTKARGTGLGLPICRRIVDAHHGAIRVHSNGARGTVVDVRLPRAQSSGGGDR
jgi:signal transduction histidine kinase